MQQAATRGSATQCFVTSLLKGRQFAVGGFGHEHCIQIIDKFSALQFPYVYRLLQWRHNELDVVSNYQPHNCLLNCLFRHRSTKTSKRRVTGLCEGIHRWPVNSPHKRPVTRKMFLFDDIIMTLSYQCQIISWPCYERHLVVIPWVAILSRWPKF